MWKYPIKSDKSGDVSLKEAYQWCNQSFFDGFTAALCETPEEFEALEVADRIAICMAAAEKVRYIKTRNATTARFYRLRTAQKRAGTGFSRGTDRELLQHGKGAERLYSRAPP